MLPDAEAWPLHLTTTAFANHGVIPGEFSLPGLYTLNPAAVISTGSASGRR